MTQQLSPRRNASKGERRLVIAHIKKARQQLKAPADLDEAIHSARQCCKKLRAMLRLMRPQIGDKRYGKENRLIRDLARPLTEIRDAKVLLEEFNKLVEDLPEDLEASLVTTWRDGLQDHYQRVRSHVVERSQVIPRIRKGLKRGSQAAAGWHIGKQGWGAVQAGLKQTYAHGQRALDAAERSLTTDSLHEWRKQAKYLWYQLKAIRPVWKEIKHDLGGQLEQLADLLGEDHDLAMLGLHLAGQPDESKSNIPLQDLLYSIDAKREELESRAFTLGRQIYRESPGKLLKRLRSMWAA